MNENKRLPVSVCIVAGNEAHRIRRALESIADRAAEIILATDPGVTDGTDKIAESFGAKVHCAPWNGHVAHRNLASAQAGQPWLLGLDADEVISPELWREIEQAISEPGARVAFSFPRCTNFCGRWIRHGDWYPDRKVRLWQRGRARWAGADVHERLDVDGPIGRLRSDLLHHMGETLDHQITKITTYTNLFAREARAEGRTAGWWDLIARPVWRFVRSYFLRRGFLDGWQGYYIAWMTAFYTVTRYVKVRAARSDGTQPQ